MIRSGTLIALLMSVLLVGCGLAEAQGARRLYVPLAARDTPPTPTPTPRPGPDLRIVSSSGRQSSSYHYVYVKMRNTGLQPAFDPRFTVTYYDATGALAGSASGSTWRSMVGPGESAVGYAMGQPRAGWTRWEVTGEYRPSSFLQYVHAGIDVTETATYRSGTSFATVHVIGRVTNNTGRTITALKVVVNLYSTGDAILQSTVEYPFSLGDVAPGATTTFDASFLDFDGAIGSAYVYEIEAEARLR